jgi:cytochrome c biogenesis protein CcdA
MDPIGLLQVKTAGALGGLVEMLPVGYAFGAGMMSSVNPCGFALLPVYLSLFLGAEEEGVAAASRPRRLGRAVLIAAVMSVGFMVVFGGLGMAISLGGRFMIAAVPWLSFFIGLGLMALGLWLLTGHHLPADFLLRLSARFGDPRTPGIRGFFLYGLTYAVCSVSCTLPVFLVVVGSAVAAGGLLAGVLQFVSYALGMGLVILVLTLAMAFFKEGLVLSGTRRLMPYMQQAMAVFVTLAGGYLIYYWVFKGGLLEGLS